jgi:hypothetical protein
MTKLHEPMAACAELARVPGEFAAIKLSAAIREQFHVETYDQKCSDKELASAWVSDDIANVLDPFGQAYSIYPWEPVSVAQYYQISGFIRGWLAYYLTTGIPAN